MFNPFGMNNIRSGFGQQSNQPYNFKGLESRLGKIETGISGLTNLGMLQLLIARRHNSNSSWSG